jgi:hypothetical protein
LEKKKNKFRKIKEEMFSEIEEYKRQIEGYRN